MMHTPTAKMIPPFAVAAILTAVFNAVKFFMAMMAAMHALMILNS